MEVVVTASAALPLAKCAQQFELFPPGQAAIAIIPSATEGGGLKIYTKSIVTKGATKS